MTRDALEILVAEEFPNAIPEKFRHLIKNTAFLIEDEPDEEVRAEYRLGPGETLLGLYRGVPHTARGEHYGIGPTLPDTITLYRLPLIEEAEALVAEGREASLERALRRAVRDTLWHEVAHHFGYDEHEVQHREHMREGRRADDCESCSA